MGFLTPWKLRALTLELVRLAANPDCSSVTSDKPLYLVRSGCQYLLTGYVEGWRGLF